MNSVYRLNLLLFLCLLFLTGCQKELTPEPLFNSFEEELEYLVEKYVRMGAAIGIIDKDQILEGKIALTDELESLLPEGELTVPHWNGTGMGLVGHVLGLVDSTSYEELVRREILEPLGMNETSLFLSDDQIANLAPGHDEDLDSVKNYYAQDVFQEPAF